MKHSRKYKDVNAAAQACLPSEQVASNGAADATEQIDAPDTNRAFLLLHKLMQGTPGWEVGGIGGLSEWCQNTKSQISIKGTSKEQSPLYNNGNAVRLK